MAGYSIQINQRHQIPVSARHWAYITDFCSPSHKLIIELDGSQHMEQKDYDAQRTAYLESKGYRVLRFWNNEVMNDLEGVVMRIIQDLEEHSHNK